MAPKKFMKDGNSLSTINKTIGYSYKLFSIQYYVNPLELFLGIKHALQTNLTCIYSGAEINYFHNQWICQLHSQLIILSKVRQCEKKTMTVSQSRGSDVLVLSSISPKLIEIHKIRTQANHHIWEAENCDYFFGICA